jgi:hypothetical protein
MNSAIVPCRVFDEDDQPSATIEEWISAKGDIPTALNSRLKAMARGQGKHASKLIGELIMKAVAEVDRYEARQAKLQLQQQFGPNWLQMLQEVEL